MNDSLSSSVAITAAGPRTRARFGILSLISVGTMISYLDRTALGIAAPRLRNDLGIDAATMGLVFSAFAWTYATFQIPGGLFLDRFGTKTTYFLSVTSWSLFTLLQAFASGLYSLLFYRFGLDVSEAPCFPASSHIVGTWFQQRERATGSHTVGEYVGLAFFSPLPYWIMAVFSWRALFIGVGVAGIVFGIVWSIAYREPGDHRSVNRAELDYIAAGGGIAAAIGVLAGGFFSDRLLASTGSANIARKTPIIGGLLPASPIVTANYVNSDSAVVAVLAIAFFGQGMVGLGWTVISDIAPKELMGLAGGLFNFAANLSGIVTPLAIGFIVNSTGSFVWALAFVGAIALLGALSYILILGDIHRIELAPKS